MRSVSDVRWVGVVEGTLRQGELSAGWVSADKLFTQKILITQLVNYYKHVKILGQEFTGVVWVRPVVGG